MRLTEESPMPFGKYKGEKMQDVPALYLLWLYENDKCSGYVKQYIQDNQDVLIKEIGDTSTDSIR